MPEMKTLTINDVTYEVVDEVARNTLSEGLLYKTEEKYDKLSKLSEIPVGKKVPLNVNGVATNFLVVHQGNPDTSQYDASCNGTWLLMEDCYTTKAWYESGGNDYKNTIIHAYLNDEFLPLLDANVQNVISQVKIPYWNGTGTGGSVAVGGNGLSTKAFLLSARELGWTTSDISKSADGGAVLNYFAPGTDALRIAYSNGTAREWYTRTPSTSSSANVISVTATGTYSTPIANGAKWIRPAIIIGDADVSGLNLYVDEESNVYSEQDYEVQIQTAFGALAEIPAQQIVGGVQIATGSYVGTDKYGAGNPNTLTFDFVPRIVIVTQNDNISLAPSGVGTWDGGFMWTYGAKSVKCGGNSNYVLVTALNGTTFTWYSANNAYTQQNSTYTYNYIAIG